MKRGALFAGTLGTVLLALAGPAAAKLAIAEAHITGPGLGAGGLRISGPDTNGMWESGIDVVGGVDDDRANSVAELGLTLADLGPRYVATYRVELGSVQMVRQHLYPYARGGPVSYLPAGQRLGGNFDMELNAGWYRSSASFFRYLVGQGLPEMSPTARAAGHELVPTPSPPARAASWWWVAAVLAGWCPWQWRSAGCVTGWWAVPRART